LNEARPLSRHREPVAIRVVGKSHGDYVRDHLECGVREHPTCGRTTVNSARYVTAESGRAPTAIIDIVAGMAIARLPLIVIDCPDPCALARFYGAMLDWKIDVSANRASVCAEYGQCISFHQVAGLHAADVADPGAAPADAPRYDR
jgi:hypothetical protein